MTLRIYHHPRCSKSRKALSLIKNKTSEFKIVEYLKYPLKFKEIKLLLSQLSMKPIELVRVKEPIWKTNYKGKKMRDNEIINTLIKHPKLMQRPIVTKDNKAIIARTKENLLNLFS